MEDPWVTFETTSGLALGAYFGFRIGAVSNRAKALVENTEWMRAATVNSYDGIQGITVQNVEVPKVLGDTDILIRVKAASLDPIDIKVSQGYGRGLRELVNKYNPNTKRETFPIVLGRDGTGVVSEVGSDVHNLAPGDRVWFIVPPCYQGSLSSFILLSSEYIRPLSPLNPGQPYPTPALWSGTS
ncbi:reticulon-4-interacting protein 1, mitochondrial isoform X2 [Eurytemora carolleeae]|uniref:reticulon-4-interacting protein 1, mitochondrial isoform X2 n=1 Tax=Eurytemora carolleeae TaxID=1294199 RepID=UPI000C755D6C|nr:reticulon-4-interacting protein 1, mitochondrial isoform X2 [Eurytemora carolleeae]|eukprot:XP_023343617.1 reticulon-4-interacting protein 1, mitochondrial-like isoform X2 [Eurytemora affinis]